MLKQPEYNIALQIQINKIGVGVLQVTLVLKMSNDLTRSYGSLEILFAEIHIRNKNTPILKCVVY